MGNISLETAERQRGESVISKVLDQLIQALAIVGARAETEKATVDTARIDAEGMLKEIRTLVPSSGSASAACAAVVAPTRRASAPFSQVAENEYRPHSILPGDAVDTRSEIKANLLVEQEAGVVAVAVVADSQKKSLQEQLDNAGVTVEEKQAMINALTEDQKTIEGILEGERVRMEGSFKNAAAARKARDEKHAEEWHEAAQLAVAGAASVVDDDGDQDPQGQEKADGSGDETDREDDRGVIAALRKAHVEQVALLESSLTAKAKSAKHAVKSDWPHRGWQEIDTRGEAFAEPNSLTVNHLLDHCPHRSLSDLPSSYFPRLAMPLVCAGHDRAKREAELVEDGASWSEVAIKADKELAAKEESQQEDLAATLASEKRPLRKRLTAYASRRSKQSRLWRRKVLAERLKAKRRAKEAERERHGAGEMERCKQVADLTRLEDLQIEALEEELLHERVIGLKDVRACAAAAEVAATVASSRATEGGEVDLRAAVLASKI
ncbi:unnamed protein product [Ectocarpus sp. CCAP 1310/34]|nr:unnamed protein product [Ectocarpus sp. CCAP 1310/34]